MVISEEDVQSIVQSALDDAIDFVESEISDQRIKAQEYYDGEVGIGEEEGRSKVVATVIRDTARAIMPPLMRIFLASGKPVEYVPEGPEDVATAELATEYAHNVFKQNNGYVVLDSCFKDAILKKQGVAKVFWEEVDSERSYSFSNLDQAQLAMLAQDEDLEFINIVESSPGLYDAEAVRIETKGKIVYTVIPPEEFFVNREARDRDSAYIIAHKTEIRVSDAVEMGYDLDEMLELANTGSSDTYDEEEKLARNGYDSDDDSDEVKDPSMMALEWTEAWMKIDVNETGIATLQKVTLAGGSRKVVDVEPATRCPFAIFEIDPEPHAFYGNSIPDMLFDDQDSSTVMLRSSLDNVVATNNPRLIFDDEETNPEDVLDNSIGSPIRSTNPQTGVGTVAIPFMAGDTLLMQQYMDQKIEGKSGVTKASTGLSADALQNQTAAAVNATVAANSGQIEIMARNLAETGMAQLFQLTLELMVENADPETMMRMSGGNYQPIDPTSWNAHMGVSVNVGLGTGQEDQKYMVLNETLQTQMQIYEKFGPNNQFVTLTQIRNTLEDKLALAGLHNSNRYYSPMDPQTEQQLLAAMQQQQGQGQPASSPEADAIVKGEQIKAQAKRDKDYADAQLKVRQQNMDDDFRRDQMDQDLLVDIAGLLGQYGIQVPTDELRARQDAPRTPVL